MHSLFLPLLTGAALLPFSLAQSLDANAIVQALTGAGLNQLAQAAASVNSTSTGQVLFSTLLSGQNVTVFAPTDAAFSNASSRLANAQPEDIANVLAYHVLVGNFSSPSTANTIISSESPNVTIARTLLNDSDLVELEGNKSQVLSWTRENDAVRFLNQNATTTVQNVTHVSTITIAVIDQVLAPPGEISEVVGSSSNLSTLAGVLQTEIPSGNGNVSLIDFVESQRGVTIFAPDNAAFGAINSSLASLASNVTALSILIGNHIINGTTVYSPSIFNGTVLTSSQGENLTFTTNSSGAYVSSAQSTAKIVQTDILVENGVVHVINGVLLNTERDEGAAESAFESATSAAAQSTTETAPLATATSPNGGTGSGSGSGSGSGDGGSGNGNGAGSLSLEVTKMMVVGVVVGLGGVLF